MTVALERKRSMLDVDSDAKQTNSADQLPALAPFPATTTTTLHNQSTV